MQFGFSGEVKEAICQCHKGQFVAGVFLVMPGAPRELLNTKMFESMAAAEKELDAFTYETATEFLNASGLKPEDAKKVEVTHGDAAVLAENRIHHQVNTTLH